MCGTLAEFPAYTNSIFPLGEQLSLLPGSLIHASPKMTLFPGE